MKKREKKTHRKTRKDTRTPFQTGESNPTSTAGRVHKSIAEKPEKLQRDWSAEERFVNRSFKIRKKVRAWIESQNGRLFETSSLMSDLCANSCGCSSITAYRWLHQYTAPDQPFKITEQEAGLVIQEREIK